MEEESGAEDSGSSADGAEEVPASGYRLLEVASAEGSENAGGLPSDQEASESDGTGAKDEGALDEDPVPLANLQTTGQSQPVYWLLFWQSWQREPSEFSFIKKKRESCSGAWLTPLPTR